MSKKKDDIFFAVDDSIEKIRDNCKTKFYLKKTKDKNVYIGKGVYGSVADACLHSNCKFVVKMTDIAYRPKRKAFVREVKLSVPMGKLGISPKVHDYFMCMNAGFIIMEKWDGSLKTLLQGNYYLPNEQKKQIAELVKRMHSYGIIHNDLHADNILYKSKGIHKEFSIIDFGLALKFRRRNEIIPDYMVPHLTTMPNIFFPTFDFVKLANSIEYFANELFEDYFIANNYVDITNVYLVEKYEKKELKKVNFLQFLSKVQLAKVLTRQYSKSGSRDFFTISSSIKKKKS